jgi:cell division protein FtsB
MAVKPRFVASALRILLLGVAGYYLIWGGEYSAFDLLRLSSLEAEEQAALVATRFEVDTLRERVELLEKDPATIERVSRERFGMIRENELLYRFVEVDSATAHSVQVAASP